MGYSDSFLEMSKLTNNVQNFINSKDTIYYNLLTNCLVYFFQFIFFAMELLFYIFKVKYLFISYSTFGFIFAILILCLSLINILLRCIFPKDKIQHLFYGCNILLVGLCLIFIATRIVLFSISQWFSLIGIVIWLLLSLIIIYGINDNIKNNYYDSTNNKIYWFKNQVTEKREYGIVVTKFTMVAILIIIILLVLLALLYYVLLPDAFLVNNAVFSKLWQLVLIYCLLLLSFITIFGWKLVIKQVYLNKDMKSE